MDYNDIGFWVEVDGCANYTDDGIYDIAQTSLALFSLNRKVGFHPTFLTLDIAQTSLALFSLNRKVAIKGGGITFAAAVQQPGAYRLAGETKPILFFKEHYLEHAQQG